MSELTRGGDAVGTGFSTATDPPVAWPSSATTPPPLSEIDGNGDRRREKGYVERQKRLSRRVRKQRRQLIHQLAAMEYSWAAAGNSRRDGGPATGGSRATNFSSGGGLHPAAVSHHYVRSSWKGRAVYDQPDGA